MTYFTVLLGTAWKVMSKPQKCCTHIEDNVQGGWIVNASKVMTMFYLS